MENEMSSGFRVLGILGGPLDLVSLRNGAYNRGYW